MTSEKIFASFFGTDKYLGHRYWTTWHNAAELKMCASIWIPTIVNNCTYHICYIYITCILQCICGWTAQVASLAKLPFCRLENTVFLHVNVLICWCRIWFIAEAYCFRSNKSALVQVMKSNRARTITTTNNGLARGHMYASLGLKERTS